jgi:hypothetical protein
VKKWLRVFLALVVGGLASSAEAQFTSTVSFDNTTEKAFSGLSNGQLLFGGVGNTSPSYAAQTVFYNTTNDLTGATWAPAATIPGSDTWDIKVTYSFGATTPGTSSADRMSVDYSTGNVGQLTATKQFNETPVSTNSGTRYYSRMRMEFSPHFNVTDLTARFNSLNTAGITWEFATVAYLDQSGSYFASAPTIDPYLAFNAANAGGLQGRVAEGWWYAASTGTVTGVGGTTGAGSNGTYDSMNGSTSELRAFAASGNRAFTSAPAQLGGMEFTSYLEDVRGTGQPASGLTASWTQFTFTATTFVPEPSSITLVLLVLPFLRRRRA